MPHVGSTYVGSSFQDDVHDADYVSLSTNTAAGASAEDLTVNGASGNGPTCPDNYDLKLDWLILNNVTSSVITATVQIYNGTTTIVLGVFTLGANTGNTATLVLTNSMFKLVAPPGYKFQVLSSASASLNAYAYARLTPGAGL